MNLFYLILGYVGIAGLVWIAIYYISLKGQSPESRKPSDNIPFKMWPDDAKGGVGKNDDEDYTNDEYNELHRKK